MVVLKSYVFFTDDLPPRVRPFFQSFQHLGRPPPSSDSTSPGQNAMTRSPAFPFLPGFLPPMEIASRRLAVTPFPSFFPFAVFVPFDLPYEICSMGPLSLLHRFLTKCYEWRLKNFFYFYLFVFSSRSKFRSNWTPSRRTYLLFDALGPVAPSSHIRLAPEFLFCFQKLSKLDAITPAPSSVANREPVFGSGFLFSLGIRKVES